MAWPYIESIPASIRSQWVAKMNSVSNALNVRPEWLMVVMYAESKLNPQAKNGTAAVGLIQFTTGTAKLIGTTKEALLKLNHIQQLDYVQKYLQKVIDWKGPLRSIGDVYIATFAPAFVRSAHSKVCYAGGTPAYRGNKALDWNQDGNITRKDVVQFIHDKIPASDRESVAFQPGGVPSSLLGNIQLYTVLPNYNRDQNIYGEPDDPTAGDPQNTAPEGFDGDLQTEIYSETPEWLTFALIGLATACVVLFSVIVFKKR